MKVDFFSFLGLQRSTSGLTSNIASVRYRELAVAQALMDLGHDVKIGGLAPTTPVDKLIAALRMRLPNALCFGKFASDAATALVRAAATTGCPINLDVCDLQPGAAVPIPSILSCFDIAHGVTCPTEEMASALRPLFAGPISVIGDPSLAPGAAPHGYDPTRAEARLVWFGLASNLSVLQSILAPLADWAERRRDLKTVTLTILTNWTGGGASAADWSARGSERLRIHCVAWSEQAVWEALAAADACLLPTLDQPSFRVKSANRLIESLAMGCLPLAGIAPAHQPFSQAALVGEDWSAMLDAIIDQAPLMAARVADGQAIVRENWTPARLAQRWVKHLEALIDRAHQ